MHAILLLKVSLLLGSAFAGAHLLRRAPATARHRLWSGAFAALLALPLLMPLLPAVPVPMPDRWIAQVLPAPGARPQATAAGTAAGQISDRRPQWDPTNAIVMEQQAQMPSSEVAVRPGADAFLLMAWLAGATAAAGALLLSLRRVRRLSRMAEVVADPAWRIDADRIGASLGLRRRAQLFWSPDVSTPMAGGMLRPAVFLPEVARSWSADERVIVLTHELAHLVARDPLRHLLARVALACYWFHPLAWLAARQASIAREQACDEVVLSRGIRPSAYARMLLDLAESLDGTVAPLGALPMVERTVLEKRVMSILNNDVRPATRLMVVIPVLVALLTLAMAAAEPRATRPQASLAGTQAEISGAPADADHPAELRSVHFSGDIRVAVSPQQPIDRASACSWDLRRGGSFNGNMSTTESGGRTLIREQVGWRGSDRVIQRDFGDLRVCMVAEGLGDRRDDGRPSQWIDRATHLVIETQRRGVVQSLEIDRGGGGRTTWRVGGAVRTEDAAARQWRTQALAVLDTTWELSLLRGEVSSLRGEISSIHGERSSLLGEISSLRGEVSSMRGSISSAYGEESSLRGEISSIRGHVSSLQGSISSERGAISSLNAGRWDLDAAGRRSIATRIGEHEAEIQRLERAIRDYDADGRVAAVEKQIGALDAAGRVAAIEAQIKAFDLEGRIAGVEKQIAALDVERKVAEIEKRITALDADRRGQHLEQRRESELKRLEAAIAALK
jgi:beta-lactamase regulating signal transducer with metallopeptidase domain